jgi:hypothetical protein
MPEKEYARENEDSMDGRSRWAREDRKTMKGEKLEVE